MKHLRFSRGLAGFLCVLCVAAVFAAPKDDSPAASNPYGLEPVKIKGLDMAFALPGATLAA